MKLFSLLLSIFVYSSCFAQQTSCIKNTWENYRHAREKTGYSSVYLTSKVIVIEDLLCIAGSEFFRNIHNFPDKATVGILNLKTSTGYLLSWSIQNNIFIITKMGKENSGISNIYTKPLKQFDLLFSNKPLTNSARTVHSKITTEYLKLLLSDID